MEFRVLGPLQVNGGYIALSAKQRIVLAVLLLHANRVVPVGTLLGALWDDAPPSSARTTLQGYVKQLRQNRTARIGERVLTRPPGYLIQVSPGELDLDRYTGLCDQARSARDQQEWPVVADLLKGALTLWRGDPLADVPSAVLHRTEAPRLAKAPAAGGQVPGGSGLAAGPASMAAHRRTAPAHGRRAAAGGAA